MNYPFLILHGWGSSSQKWTQVKDYLEKNGFKVYVPDLPGFGESPPPKEAWSIDNYAEWVKDYCEKQNISQVFLLGHSFGGAIATKFALKYPEKIKKLFFVAPSLIRRKTLKKEIIKKIAKPLSFLPHPAKKVVYIKLLKSDYPLQEGTMRKTFLKVIKEDQLAESSNISLPTIIIWGEKDDVTPLKNAYSINEKIKGSKLVIIEGQNHDLNKKVPEILAQKILENI